MNKATYRRFRESLHTISNPYNENDPLFYHRGVEEERVARPDLKEVTIDPSKELPTSLRRFWKTYGALRYLVLYCGWATGPWTISYEEV